MKETIITAGFGGQGIIFMGRLLAHAGLLEGRNVTCLPSYGPEMKGGTANCMVVISDQKIGSPYVIDPFNLIAMNGPSLDRFETVTREGGCILINESMVDRQSNRSDLKVAYVQATKIAHDLGDVRVANMVALGAFLKTKPLVQIESITTSMKNVLSNQKYDMILLNWLCADMWSYHPDYAFQAYP